MAAISGANPLHATQVTTHLSSTPEQVNIRTMEIQAALSRQAQSVRHTLHQCCLLHILMEICSFIHLVMHKSECL